MRHHGAARKSDYPGDQLLQIVLVHAHNPGADEKQDDSPEWGWYRMEADSPDVVIAKQLLDDLKVRGFKFDGSPRVTTGRWWEIG